VPRLRGSPHASTDDASRGAQGFADWRCGCRAQLDVLGAELDCLAPQLLGVMRERLNLPFLWRSVVATPAAGEVALWQPKR
jgi:hypothetical protein